MPKKIILILLAASIIASSGWFYGCKKKTDVRVKGQTERKIAVVISTLNNPDFKAVFCGNDATAMVPIRRLLPPGRITIGGQGQRDTAGCRS